MWKYMDNGSNLSTAWTSSTFNDSGWKTGIGMFGYDISGLQTVISFGPDAKKKHITTYFRKIIEIPDASIYESYTVNIKRDDGVVMYVNGVEVLRNNMPTGTITYTTTAIEAKDNGKLAQSYIVPASNFTSGANIIAIEVHQHRANSSDLAFDLEFIGNEITKPANQPPTVSISSPTEGTNFILGQQINITAIANDPDGSLANVEFYANGTIIGQDVTTPYSLSWTPATTGSFRLNAKAVDEHGANAASSDITVTIVEAPPLDQTPPVITNINRQEPIAEVTTATSVTFRAAFSEKVTGVDAADFAVIGISGNITGNVSSVTEVSNSGSMYDITVNSIAGSGKIRLDLKSAGTGISDEAGNPIDGGYTSGQSYTIDLEVAQPPSNTTLIPFMHTWKYLDDGSDQGTAWRTVAFNDDGWKTGTGKFGYGISDAATIVSYGSDASNRHITTYFRKSISIADDSKYSGYRINIKRDDGVVVYVNGVEMVRDKMPSGTIYYNTLASGAAGSDNGATPISFDIPAEAFKSGTNVIAVEIHQNTVSSIDIAFDLELTVTPAPSANNTILKVATWNIFFFGADKDSNGKVVGAADDQLQFTNVKKAIQILNPDIIALQEVANDTMMERLVSELSGYRFVRSPSYSYSERSTSTPQIPLKLYVLYRSSRVVVKRNRPLFKQLYSQLLANQAVLANYPGSSSSAAKNDDGFWDSGRLPYLVEAEVTMNGVKIPLNIVNIHAIAQTTSLTGYERRKYDAQVLKDSLSTHFQNANILMLGDYNDDVDVSLLDNLPSPYKPYVDDNSFRVLTYELSLTGIGTTGSGKEFRDHISTSGQLNAAYVDNSISINTEMKRNIFNYSSTTSDHLPVTAQFNIGLMGSNFKNSLNSNLSLASTSTQLTLSDENTSLSLYPNPTHGDINIRFTNHASFQSDIRLTMWSMEGKLVVDIMDNQEEALMLIQEKVRSMPKGIYHLKILDGFNIYQTKLIKL